MNLCPINPQNPESHKFKGNVGDVTKQIGNAVPRRLARAIVAAALSQKTDVSWLAERCEEAA